jgi:2-keto-4-pentenoate hydratase
VYVVGDPAPGFPLDQLPETVVTVRRGGEEVATGTGANVLDDPLEALAWLATRLASLGLGLEEGQIVFTGAAALWSDTRPGERYTADFGRLGSVSVTLL